MVCLILSLDKFCIAACRLETLYSLVKEAIQLHMACNTFNNILKRIALLLTTCVPPRTLAFEFSMVIMIHVWVAILTRIVHTPS